MSLSGGIDIRKHGDKNIGFDKIISRSIVANEDVNGLIWLSRINSMTRIYAIFFFLLISGCTQQRYYRAYVYIINSCDVPLTVSVKNDSQYISTPYTGELTGKGNRGSFPLDKGERKLLADFRLAKNQEFISYFNTPGDFSLDVSYGSKKTTLSGEQIFQLLEKHPLKKDDSDHNYSDLNDSSLCPL